MILEWSEHFSCSLLFIAAINALFLNCISANSDQEKSNDWVDKFRAFRWSGSVVLPVVSLNLKSWLVHQNKWSRCGYETSHLVSVCFEIEKKLGEIQFKG